ncbi:MAG TPA: DUF2806 domain-containing protein [Stellaceae bacterium]|nr:DUF2806 domain-containing protein [Stellaceae bacterium]
MPKILAGEANSPGYFAKRTLDNLSSLDKSDAELFSKLAVFTWVIGTPFPLILNVNDAVFEDAGITFPVLNHLDDIGLITFENISGFRCLRLSQKINVQYFVSVISLELPQEKDNHVEVGKVLFTQVGIQLLQVCSVARSEKFFEYILARWADVGYLPSSPLR